MGYSQEKVSAAVVAAIPAALHSFRLQQPSPSSHVVGDVTWEELQRFLIEHLVTEVTKVFEKSSSSKSKTLSFFSSSSSAPRRTTQVSPPPPTFSSPAPSLISTKADPAQAITNAIAAGIPFSFLSDIVSRDDVTTLLSLTEAVPFDRILESRDSLTRVHIVDYAAGCGSLPVLSVLLRPEYCNSSKYFMTSQISQTNETCLFLLVSAPSIREGALGKEALKEVIRQMARFCGDENARNTEGDTVLHEACKHSSVMIIEVIRDRNIFTTFPRIFLQFLLSRPCSIAILASTWKIRIPFGPLISS
jgi:hypothetical protein